MIFFHGTSENFLKDIKKNGLRSVTDDQWLTEITGEKFCCIASKPNAGEGGSPSYFAVQGARERNCDGYLVVMDVEENNDFLAILDNKVLDDYVRFHFFVREEFRKVGYEMYKVWKKKSYPNLKKRRARENDSIIFDARDQRGYYKDLRKEDNRFMYDVLGIEVSDEFVDFIEHVGLGKPFYHFLQIHFTNVDENEYREFNTQYEEDHCEFWRSFYAKFPLKITEKKWQYVNEWFSPKWLQERKLDKANRNSQVLIKSVTPDCIVGFIHIASPSGFIKKFRPSKAKGGSFSQMVWREVFQMTS